MDKLLNIQYELKCNKSQYNSFGKYYYRNCEDILEAVKPLCKKYNCSLVISDDIELIGDRYYIKATATLYDCSSKEEIVSVVAYAREEENKKGMDSSQVTGATSSYARKYALNGLFNIDDTKDTDTEEYHEKDNKSQSKSKAQSKAKPQATDKAKPQATSTDEKAQLLVEIQEYYKNHINTFKPILNATLNHNNVVKISDLPIEELRGLVDIARSSKNTMEG